MPRIAVVTFALLLALPSAVALDPLGLQDDAATGADAPDARANAASLPAGSYVGSLDGVADREDWFLATAQPDERVRVTYQATEGAFFLRVVNAAGQQVFQGFSSGTEFLWAGNVGASYRLGFATDEGSTGASYSFLLDLAALPPQADAGAPGDAGGTRAEARAVVEGAFTGALYPSRGDVRDWYSLTPPAGMWSRVTLTPEAGRSATLELVGASGNGLGSGVASDAPVTLVSSGIVASMQVWAPAPGVLLNYTVLLEFIAPLPPPAQNDAGSGIDAPDSVVGAPILGEGTYTGRLEFGVGDKNDWFALDVPEGLHVRATLTLANGFAYFGIYGPTGREAQGQVRGGGTASIVGSGDTGARGIGIGDFDGGQTATVAYTLTLAFVEPADAAVLEVRVDPVPGMPHLRNVHVKVANLGGEPLPETVLDIDVRDSFGFETSIGGGWVALPPYSVAEFDATWNTLTFVGEFTVMGDWVHARDPHPGNDELGVRASALVDPGMGEGASPFLIQPLDIVDAFAGPVVDEAS